MANIIDAFDLYNKKRDRTNPKDSYGVIISVSGSVAQVRVTGSQQLQEAATQTGQNVQPGDRCLISAIRQGNPRLRWVISNVFAERETGDRSHAQQPYPELFPPQNFESINMIPGVVTVQWDAPVTLPVVFEVQTSEDEVYVEDTLLTRGSYAILKKSYSPVYVRIRSIAPDGQPSAWSDWLSVTPDTATTISYTTLHYSNAPLFYQGQQVVYIP